MHIYVYIYIYIYIYTSTNPLTNVSFKLASRISFFEGFRQKWLELRILVTNCFQTKSTVFFLSLETP